MRTSAATIERRLERKKKDIRADAIARSRVTTLGKTIERIAPMFSGFGHHPADVRPIFDPIDYLSFTGLFMGKVTELVLIEFKTGDAALTPIQRSVRDAIEGRRVRFEERRISREVLKRLSDGRPAASRPLIELCPRLGNG